MKHIKKLTLVRAETLSWSDFWNSISRNWADFLYAKKNEVAPGGGGQ